MCIDRFYRDKVDGGSVKRAHKAFFSGRKLSVLDTDNSKIHLTAGLNQTHGFIFDLLYIFITCLPYHL